MIAQGSKEVLLGDDCYRYDADHYLITAAALPTANRVTEASEERPYLGVVLGLDPALVGSVMVEAGHPAPGEKAAVRAFEVSPLNTGLLDAVVRLVGLVQEAVWRAAYARRGTAAGSRHGKRLPVSRSGAGDLSACLAAAAGRYKAQRTIFPLGIVA